MDHSADAKSVSPTNIVQSMGKVETVCYTSDEETAPYSCDGDENISELSIHQPFIEENNATEFASAVVTPSSQLSSVKRNRYGWGCCTPAILQPIFNNAKAFLFFVTISNIVQGIIVNGLVKVNVTSIERHFQLLSSESGIIISSYDIAGCLCLLPMSYIGGRGHKPRWISFGMLLIAIGTIILALPNFIVGPYQYKRLGLDDEPQLCMEDNSSNVTSNDNRSNYCADMTDRHTAFQYMKYVFILGQFVIGIGCTPLSILAVTMIDESVNRDVYPIHIGIFYLGALLGPAIGFILGGKLLSIFTDLSQAPSDITPESPSWVGAWWIGFLLSGALAFILCVPLFGYPSKLRQSTKGKSVWYFRNGHKVEHSAHHMQDMQPASQRMEKCITKNDFKVSNSELMIEDSTRIEIQDSYAASSKASSTEMVKDFCSDLIQVLSNKAFVFLSVSAAIFSTLVSGFSSFGPKFIESQLGKSAADAAYLFGYVCVPAGASGMFIGAFLMVGLKMNYEASLKVCIAVSTASLVAHFVLILDCQDPMVAGISVPYRHNFSLENVYDKNLTVLDTCNAACSCHNQLPFNPVCGDDHVTYFSPCHAGCAVYDSTDNVYAGCACLTSGFNHGTPGFCRQDCKWETLILFSLFFIILSTFMCTIPGVDISLRCFPDHQRSLAIGVQWILIRTLGTVPGPILFGAVIDGACSLRDKANCDSKGSCLLYQNSKLSFSFLVLSFTYKVAGIISLSLALLYVKSCVVDYQATSQSSRAVQANPESSNRAGHGRAGSMQFVSSIVE